MNSENNDFILSADPLSNSSDSVNIKELEVDSGELKKNGESLPTETHILISDTDGLNKLSTLVNDNSFGFSGYTIKLTKNLTLADPDLNQSNFTPIGKDSTHAFNGTFDGQGNTISNLQISGVEYAGLFGYLDSSATVKNLDMIDSDISAVTNSNAYLGGIAGVNSGTIENCYNSGAVTASYTNNAYLGGIAGINYGTITNCYNTGNVTATYEYDSTYSGGIAGENHGTITNCYNTGNVTATANIKAYSGGIAGENDQGGTITNCYNTGSVNSYKSSGGIAGENHGTITNCYNTGAVTGSNSGGIAGENHGTITNCYNTGAVTGSNSGGIAGKNDKGTITNCYNTGSVNSYKFSGGIAGDNSGGKITNCYNTGAVTANSTNSNANSGGIVGSNSSNGTIENCYNSGAVTAITNSTSTNDQTRSGGIAGANSGKITNCYNTGSVNSYKFSGGIAGYNDGTITNCYNTGAVTADSTIMSVSSGGISGYNYGTITNCYNTGAVTANSTNSNANSGGIVGNNQKSIENCYYLGTANDSIEGTTNLSEDKMKGLKLLSGTGENSTNLNKGQDSTKPWSPDIFGVNNGYPILADVPLSIILGNSVPHSSVYLTFNDEAYQSKNYLKPKVIIADPNNKLSVNLINLNTDLKVDAENASYEWKKLGVNSFDNIPNAISSSIPTSSPADNGTYQAVVTFNVKESEKDTYVDYHYTSLSRTADIKYSVTYDANNGKGLMIDENSPYSSGDEVTILDNTFIAPNGRTFTGWSTESGETTVDTQYTPDNIIDIDKNINLYAVWKDIKYSVYYYYLNDNNKVTIDSNKSPGDAVNVKDIPVKSGYTFKGWLKYLYGDTTPTTIQANATFKMPSSDVIMIADWEKTSSGGSTSYVKQYSVIYVSDADTSNVPYDSKSYNSGSSASVLKNNLSKEGFISNGWNTKADGTGTQYNEGDKVKITSSNIILYAQFKEDSPEPIGPDTPNSASVTFYVDDKVYDTIYVIKGSCLENNMPDNPEKQNSTFKGWFYSDSEGNESEFNSESIVNNDMSIHAVFESNKDSNASSLSSSEIIIIVAVIALIAAALILYLFFFRKQ